MMHYKECPSEEPKSRQEIGLAVLLHTSAKRAQMRDQERPVGCSSP